MEKRGLYYHLVMSQEKSDTTDTVSDHDDDTRSNMTAVNQVRKFSEPLKTESQPEKNTTKSAPVSLWTILKLTKTTEWFFNLFGLFGATLLGLSTP